MLVVASCIWSWSRGTHRAARKWIMAWKLRLALSQIASGAAHISTFLIAEDVSAVEAEGTMSHTHARMHTSACAPA